MRLRTFDPDKALEAAMMLFWQRGYEAVSFDDLVEATGASRKGLYGLWKGKDVLFGEAIRIYRNYVGELFFTTLEQPEAGLSEIAAFWQAFETAAKQPQWRGCLVMRTASDQNLRLAAASQEVALYLDRFLGAFRHALSNAKTAGDLPEHVMPDIAADQALAIAMAISNLGMENGYTGRVADMVRAGRHACGLKG